MKKFLLGLVVCAGFCACSNDDVVVSTTTTPALGGDGYISLAINLPTTPSTRAANDVYDDGLATEYAVSDATLLLFGGASESTATYYASYTLGTEDWNKYEGSTDNITTRKQITQQIDASPSGGDIYALVVVNNNGLLTPTGINPTLVVGETTLSSLQSTMQILGGVSAMTSNGFFMCNAPLIDAKGGSSDPSTGTVTTLAKIDASKIFASEAEAKVNSAAEIYVERGMAKVTVAASESMSTASNLGTVYISGFALDQTNNVTYLVRNTTGSEDWWSYYNGSSEVASTDKYRFAGSVEIGGGLYRTYWAEDPNYSSVPDEGDLTSLAGTTFDDTNIGDENPQYCLENTMNVTRMNQDESTRAIIKATLNGGADFYTWDGDKSTMYNATNIQDLILTAFEADGYVEVAAQQWVGGLQNNLYNHVHVVLSATTSSDDVSFTISYDDTDNEGINADNFGGTLPNVFDPTSDAYAEMLANLNAAHQIAYYEGGESYYPVLIKHFGDDLTPWDITEVGSTSSYPDNNENYGSLTGESNWLGRYGVLRNNWYDIQVTAINNIGSATVPEAYGESNDPVEQWMSIEINILSWAKRTQDVSL